MKPITPSPKRAPPPSADLRYGGKGNISPITLIFATRKSELGIYTVFIPLDVPKKLALG